MYEIGMDKIVSQDNFLKDHSIRSELLGRAMWRVADRFNIRRTESVFAVTLLSIDEYFENAICDAEDNGVLADCEYYRIIDTDMIVQGISRDTGKDTYVAVESSFTIADSDIVRANRTASALRKVFPDADVWATVYCAEISDENTQPRPGRRRRSNFKRPSVRVDMSEQPPSAKEVMALAKQLPPKERARVLWRIALTLENHLNTELIERENAAVRNVRRTGYRHALG